MEEKNQGANPNDGENPKENEPGYDPYFDDEENADDLEGFLFFKQLEENEGKPTRAMMKSGCFMVLPVIVILSLVLFFVLTRLY